MNKEFNFIRKNIPTNPGVYLYKNNLDKIIYVGKAKNLRNRVSSYFTKNQSGKTQILVSHIKDLEFFVVDNEVEALLLENKLIKKYKPKYNIMLKDSKTYAYLKITDEKFPKLQSTRIVTKKGKYFGPYTDGSARFELMQLAIKLFNLRVCKTLPKRACLNFHIGLCTAPCIEKVTKNEYSKQVKDASKFLKGDTKEIINLLKKDMKKASKEMKYEMALEKKRQIEAVELLKERQKVDLVRHFDQNIIAFMEIEGKAHIIVFNIKKGVISSKKEYSFDNDEDVLESFVKLYYSQNTVPNEIIISRKFWKTNEEKKVVEQYLSRIKGLKAKITYPKMGDKLSLVKLALKNISVKTVQPLKDLMANLTLPNYPKQIECFDISNLGYDYVVGAMAQWVDGKPNKESYRKFEIKGQTGQDDFAAMKEVVHRRYKRLLHEGGKFPDLIIIDGGRGQLHSSLDALKELGVKLPIISLAKREEEIFIPGRREPLRFDKSTEMMLMVRRIRDSVHKLAISYNRKKREMRLREETTKKN